MSIRQGHGLNPSQGHPPLRTTDFPPCRLAGAVVLIPLRVTRLFVRKVTLSVILFLLVLIPLRVTRLFVPILIAVVLVALLVLIPLRVTRLFVRKLLLECVVPQLCLNPSQGHPPLRTGGQQLTTL